MLLESLLETSTKHDLQKHDYTCSTAEIRFDESARMLIPVTNLFQNTVAQPLAPTDWAWGQIFSKLGPAVFGNGSNRVLPRDYLLSIPSDLLAGNLNRHVTNVNGKKWLVRAYQDRARAVLSTNYARIDNTQVLERFLDVFKRQQTADTQLIRPHVNVDSLHLKAVWKDMGTPGGNYGVGVYIGNGETGNNKLVFKPLIQRHSCTNSIIIDDEEGVEARHVGDVEFLLYKMDRVIAHVFNLSGEWLQRKLQADQLPINNFAEVLEKLALDNGWSETVKTAVAVGTEGRETLGGIIDGITLAAHTAVTDPDEQIKMETYAGLFLKQVTPVDQIL